MADLDVARIQKILLGFAKRAERANAETLTATFVDAAPLFDLLSTNNNQVVYGRRGTGKTHALKYLSSQIDVNKGDYSVFVDLRTVGSNGSIYGDSSRTLAERASLLISDVLSALLNEFYTIAVGVIDGHPFKGRITQGLDDFQNAISTVVISGAVSQEEKSSNAAVAESKAHLEAAAGPRPKISGGLASHVKEEAAKESTIKRNGSESIHVVFGKVAGCLGNLVDSLGVNRIWLLLDEWSEIPVDLQPYLADMLRRTVFPIDKFVVKIAAIEHRTNFIIHQDGGQYLGIELGADASADLNLDDFLVFDNDQERSRDFISNLLFRHYNTSPEVPYALSGSGDLISHIFSQKPVFDEFVRAVEGVPRDALSLIGKVVTKAHGRQAAMEDVRAAARDWYQQDKSAVIRNNQTLSDLLERIIRDVIGTRKARAFLLPSATRSKEIDALFDARLLHVLKKSISSHDTPGVRYDVYKIDYGCYVELITTTKSPLGLFEADESYVEVPKDDYRSIRRAILQL